MTGASQTRISFLRSLQSPKRIKIRIVTLFPGMQPGIGNLEVDADFYFLVVCPSLKR
jgi:hypothetical protein